MPCTQPCGKAQGKEYEKALLFKSGKLSIMSDLCLLTAPGFALTVCIVFSALALHFGNKAVKFSVVLCVDSLPGVCYDAVLYLLPDNFKLIGA